MQDVQDEPLFVQRVAGLDIAKAEVEVEVASRRRPPRPWPSAPQSARLPGRGDECAAAA
jgi:hypothetical protein